ncbi:glycosyltransferase family protein [Enterococcus casseliflavus]|uniref:hypothetical protein n=1 Tax=Enterococcus casseliflavus TaxID=37734 RepID=UPI0035E3A517
MKAEPRILVISNNSFSSHSNNGKTLSSFFSLFSNKNISQLFFKKEIPDNVNYFNYFRISDADVLFGRDGEQIFPYQKKCTDAEKSKLNFKGEIFRLMREVIWKIGNWKSESLIEWLEEFQPDIIFLCGGDSIFAYEIANFICKKYEAKLVLYITDDYITNRNSLRVFYFIRRNLLFKKMKQTVENASLFYTISDLMSQEYEKIFGKKSKVISNFQDFSTLESDRVNKSNLEENKKINLIYAGGLHYRRNETLQALVESIELYNKTSIKKAHLSVYTNLNNMDNHSFKLQSSCVTIHDIVSEEKLKIILNNCDIPVHVESFDKKSRIATRLSLSTKISEYLSLGKPILAIGPEEIASMRHLQDSAFCITELSDLNEKLIVLLENDKLRSDLSKKSENLYKKAHNKNRMQKELYEDLLNI